MTITPSSPPSIIEPERRELATVDLQEGLKLKAVLRKAAARTVPDLRGAIHDARPLFSPHECANYFGYVYEIE
jgi:hypothetical protein